MPLASPLPLTMRRESSVVHLALAASVALIVVPLLFSMRVAPIMIRIPSATVVGPANAGTTPAEPGSAPSFRGRGEAARAGAIRAGGAITSAMSERELALILLLDSGSRP